MAHRSRNVIGCVLVLAAAAAAQPLPRVLIIGDSISIGYTPIVKELLAGKATVEHHEGNAADSANVRAKIDSWLAKGPFDVITFNCGLHDLKYTAATTSHQIGPEQYMENLPWIVNTLQESGAKIIWMTTTPIDDEHVKRGTFIRYEKDVVSYNDMATSNRMRMQIPVCDLHAVVMKAGFSNVIGPDGTHYTPAGYRLLAETVVQAITPYLAQAKIK